ncbi:hypothetical protein PVAP13_1KG001066 [Panicum virgatum]|uniref:Uncharacterized protein n=1 Tax=Panicum virgatum TaxID=38727 RepID=A0A8T0XD80_PANVG|nr:hypothetical protein PVAP13_1KG001066 [Panicum virgatum]
MILVCSAGGWTFFSSVPFCSVAFRSPSSASSSTAPRLPAPSPASSPALPPAGPAPSEPAARGRGIGSRTPPSPVRVAAPTSLRQSQGDVSPPIKFLTSTHTRTSPSRRPAARSRPPSPRPWQVLEWLLLMEERRLLSRNLLGDSEGRNSFSLCARSHRSGFFFQKRCVMLSRAETPLKVTCTTIFHFVPTMGFLLPKRKDETKQVAIGDY